MTAQQILEQLPSRRALVVGDICLDRWCTYDPAAGEASRETGLPRVGVVSTELTPGGAGTVANNLAALGVGRVAVLGIIGEDGFGYELKRALQSRGIGSELALACPGLSTYTYTKLLNAQTGEEDLPRVDFINARAAPPDVEAELCARLLRHAPEFDVIFVSDQAEAGCGGVVTARLREALQQAASQWPDKLFWVDSRARAEHFQHLVVKPNEQEAREACLRLFGRMDYEALRQHLAAPLLIVTQGAAGVQVVQQTGQTLVPTVSVAEPVDICGAGDSFSAGAAMALQVTGDPVAAARFGNLVASITIMKKGTGTASPAELLQAEAAHV